MGIEDYKIMDRRENWIGREDYQRKEELRTRWEEKIIKARIEDLLLLLRLVEKNRRLENKPMKEMRRKSIR